MCRLILPLSGHADITPLDMPEQPLRDKVHRVVLCLEEFIGSGAASPSSLSRYHQQCNTLYTTDSLTGP